MTKEHNHASAFIDEKLKGGLTPAQVAQTLVDGGWTPESAQAAVNDRSGVPKPPSGIPAPPPQTTQTGNMGIPMQMESVQYNMVMAPVESRVGYFLNLAPVGLWVMLTFIASTLSAFVAEATDSETEVATLVVFTISLSVAAIPLYFIANKKLHQEIAKNKALVDDLFFKKTTRSGLYASVVISSLFIIAAVYNILAKLFLGEGDGSIAAFFQCSIFAAASGVALYYYWKLHSLTRR